MGGSGSSGDRTTIDGVVRIPCAGGFPGGNAEDGGMGMRRFGLGGRPRSVIVLEGVCDGVLCGEAGADAGDDGLVGEGRGCRCGFRGCGADGEAFWPKPRIELAERNKDCRVLPDVGVVGVGVVTKTNFDRSVISSVDIATPL